MEDVIIIGGGPVGLSRYSTARRATFLERVSPQATANKQLIVHANGGGPALEEALAGVRRQAADPAHRLQRLMFSRSLETARLL